DLTVKSGNVGDIEMGTGGYSLKVQGGTMQDVSCEGDAEVTGGTMKSLEAENDVKVSGGTIRRNVLSDSGEVTLSSTVSIGGDVTGRDVTLSSGVKADIGGTVKVKENLFLSECNLSVKSFDGDTTASLEIKDYKEKLPDIENMSGVVVDSNCTAIAGSNLTADCLNIKKDAAFVTTYALDLDSLYGPGTLIYQAGKMTIHTEIKDDPLLIFSSAVQSGTAVFKADAGAVSDTDVEVYDYEMDSDREGSYDVFKLKSFTADGLTLDHSSLALTAKTPGVITATVKPALSKFADGTKIVWVFNGDTAGFSMSGSDQKCTVSVASSGMHRAVVTAYLADKNGDRLTDYHSGSCAVTAGYDDAASTGSPGTGTGSASGALDTSSVSILIGTRYTVFAAAGTSSAPRALSYNSAVALVGAGTPATVHGQSGYLYAITGSGKGQTTIDIGGQKVAAAVSNGIMSDTASYTMSPGQSYVIGLSICGVDPKSVNVHSINGCTEVQFLKKAANSLYLYRVTGKTAGTGAVLFELPNSAFLRTEFNLTAGAARSGSSARTVALA
ncbi:MAG TPA: hypothetical protein VHR86_05770, partial [Armatimonadota bacterium]|nr:hypothetical protein [Armatimonadota bacterium]